MSDLLQNVIQARAGGAVSRSHTTRQIGSNSVAEHTWGAMMLLLQLFPDHFTRLGAYLLCHDVPEFQTGDTPAPVKRYAPEVSGAIRAIEDKVFSLLDLPNMDQLPDCDLEILNACDKLELYLWALEQRSMGNLFVMETIQELEIYFLERPLPEPANLLLEELKINSVLPRQSGFMRNLNNDG